MAAEEPPVAEQDIPTADKAPRQSPLRNPATRLIVIIVNWFAFIAVAYLAGRLSGRLSQIGVELRDKSGELQNLQALHTNIIQSISAGLITTGSARASSLP